MPEAFQHVARPSSEAESPGVSTPRGVNRSHLTLYISIAAILLSIASAGVNLFVFIAAGQRKTINEADEIQLKASANRVLQEVTSDPKSHPQLSEELNRLYKNLIYRPPFDAKLTVYERASFGLVVESYAVPLLDVQVRTVQTRENLLRDGFGTKERFFTWDEIACFTDPYGYECPETKHTAEEVKK